MFEEGVQYLMNISDYRLKVPFIDRKQYPATELPVSEECIFAHSIICLLKNIFPAKRYSKAVEKNLRRFGVHINAQEYYQCPLLVTAWSGYCG